jgi:hypothetical protein
MPSSRNSAERRRVQVKQAVEGFARDFPACRFLLTSRTYAYQNQDWRLPGFAETTLAPLHEGQIRRFVRRWYEHAAVLGRLSADDARGRAALLESAVFSRPQLRDLAERPLLLTLMASLHAWRGGTLPEQRERLYADTVDLLLEFWEGRRVVFGVDKKPKVVQPSLAEYLEVGKEQVREVLEDLAFHPHAGQPDLEGTADIAEGDLLGRLLALSERGTEEPANTALLVHYLRDRAGILAARGVGVYTFPHRSFQEYLAACRLTGDTFPGEIARLARSDPGRWREVALLAAAKAARGAGAAVWQLADTPSATGKRRTGSSRPRRTSRAPRSPVRPWQRPRSSTGAYCGWLGERLREHAGRRTDAGGAEDPQGDLWRALAEGRLRFGLPSDAEWERAARHTDGRPFPWGGEADSERASYVDTGIGATSAVGCFGTGASVAGCEDMSGNVWEWTRSLHGDYPYPDDPEGRRNREDPKASGRRVLRGGAFDDFGVDVRCAYRDHNVPNDRNLDLGFRVVLSPFL